MEQYLIDSNVVSDYLSASLSAAGIDFLDSVIDAGPNLSVISQIELLCWNTDKATTEKVKNFIADSVILDISPDVVAHCVALRKGKKIKTPRTTAQPALACCSCPCFMPEISLCRQWHRQLRAGAET